ncbi:phosphotransferase [Arthrobacter halodurans]|uniref:Phosphotransferase n=1 Tax=Arthrobacter halodurans TaxID=516699 RepID=A0ABV4UTJ9_9MICC
MELAAIATAAVPGLTPVGVAGIPDDADDFDAAVIVDGQRNRWRVRSPRHAEASMRLETELTALRSFTPGIRADLPFRLPSVAGTVRQGSLRTFVYNHLPGSVLDLDELIASGGRTAEDIGRTIAAIHGLPEDVVDRADLPSYTANEFRQRRLNELDQAATTGRIPARLLLRWEHALEDAALWRFNPTVVHGDLHEENLLLEDGKITAVTGWTDLRIGDPADDLAWLAAAHEQSFADSVLEAYVAVRGKRSDPHLMRRAALAAEFALAQWLAKGIAAQDPERIAEAEQMLRDLDEDIAEYGGQPISIVEPTHAPGDGAPDTGTGNPDNVAWIGSAHAATPGAPGSGRDAASGGFESDDRLDSDDRGEGGDPVRGGGPGHADGHPGEERHPGAEGAPAGSGHPHGRADTGPDADTAGGTAPADEAGPEDGPDPGDGSAPEDDAVITEPGTAAVRPVRDGDVVHLPVSPAPSELPTSAIPVVVVEPKDRDG